MASLMSGAAPSVGTLFDIPVSNNGARCRMVLYYKAVSEQEVAISSPMDLGGLRSDVYLDLNPQGKMPLLTLAGGEPIPESDTIARFLCARFAGQGPDLMPRDPVNAAKVDRICRLHDIYLGAVQPAMYKAAGSGGVATFPPFGSFASRRDALAELARQLEVLESYADATGPYLCGPEPTLADCTVWPTALFWQHMLPKFEEFEGKAIFGPRLERWASHMRGEEVGSRVAGEIEGALAGWDAKDRWATILGAGTRDKYDATIFDKILAKEIPSEAVYEDELVYAFRDISPVAPTHVLLIPKKRDGLTQLQKATPEHKAILGHMLAVGVPAVVSQEKLGSYRLVVNDGEEACQSVFHLHMHIIGGKALTWPPGA